MFAVVTAAALLSAEPGLAVLPDMRGPTDAVSAENSPEMIELFRVRFDNKKDGDINISRDGGAGWEKIGRVLIAAGAVNPSGYTASGWAPAGSVAATAVNAVHIKLRQNADRGVLISILPKEFYAPPQDYNSYYSRNSSIVTNMRAGTSFFGGGESPFIGCPVLLERDGSAPAPLPDDYVPRDGDALTVVVERPAEYPSEIVFENRFGGFVTAKYAGSEPKIIAQVLKPFFGVGRFGGSLYAGTGRIRANHTGVICVSTSPTGEIGGFQIIPDNHAMSPEMWTARSLTQWMVVGPPSVTDPSLEGVAPLFRYFIRPVHYRDDFSKKTMDRLLGSFIVQVRLDGGEWIRMPEFTGRVDDAFKKLSHVRILFPLEWKE